MDSVEIYAKFVQVRYGTYSTVVGQETKEGENDYAAQDQQDERDLASQLGETENEKEKKKETENEQEEKKEEMVEEEEKKTCPRVPIEKRAEVRVCSFICMCGCSFVCSVACSFVFSFVCSFVCSFLHFLSAASAHPHPDACRK